MVMDELMSTEATARCPGPLARQPVHIVDGRLEGGYIGPIGGKRRCRKR